MSTLLGGIVLLLSPSSGSVLLLQFFIILCRSRPEGPLSVPGPGQLAAQGYAPQRDSFTHFCSLQPKWLQLPLLEDLPLESLVIAPRTHEQWLEPLLG